MPITIPTTQEITDQNLANIEARLNQTTPASDRAFNAVLAVMEALAYTSLYKYAADRSLAAYVMTAQGEDLDNWGAEYAVPRKTAVAAVLVLTLTGTNATVIPAGTVFVADANFAQYISQAEVTIAAGTCAPVVAAVEPGTSGNLTPGDTLVLVNQIAGASGVPVVASTTTTGADAESDDAYRVRVLDVQRAQGGGGNSADYRNWAQAVAGVVRCFPFSGPPWDSGITPSPPQRTLYIECTTTIQADGIAPQPLLDQVRAEATTDPLTGLARQPLGLTDATLYVQAISRTAIYVQVSALNVPSGQTAQCQTAIAAAMTTYLAQIEPFVTGLDPAFGRNDTITNLTISRITQAVLTAYGASAANIGFGLGVGVFNSSYTVQQGERAKLGAIAYV